MRALFWILALAAIGVALALLGRLNDGYVLWVLPPWRLEMSFNVFVVVFLAVLLLFHGAIAATTMLADLPRKVAEYRRRQTSEVAWAALVDAMRLYWEGRYGAAMKSADAAYGRFGLSEPEHGEKARRAASLAAQIGLRAAHALGEANKLAEWRARAEACDEAGWADARLLGELKEALDAHDFAAARHYLERLSPAGRRRLYAQRLALRLAMGSGAWANALQLVRQLEKHRALLPEQAATLRLKAARALIDEAGADAERLRAIWRGLARSERDDSRIIGHLAKRLAEAGACDEAAEIVESALAERWEPELLEAYAECAGGDLLRRIAHAEEWLHAHPRDGRLLLLLGRLCLARELWGKARGYLEASLAVEESRAAHLLLAELLDRLGAAEEANRHYRAAARL